METPKTIRELVERFEAHRDIYASQDYNEAQVRQEFINPFFECLGWDVQNKKGFAEPYKEVVHEDAIKVGGATKAPDYSFRLGGRRLFFLEAKKPAVNIKDDPAPAYQLRRYAWTAKLPVSILTDFEDFIIYDTRVKPAATDKASAARVLCIHYKEYPARWEELVALFSPQAIQKGALDKYVESTGKKRGTAEVDDAFLAEIEEWRDLIARNIALRNNGLSQRDLNFAVQITIDRIIFLRICEDRAIENYGQLQALLNGDDTYARLRVLYERADERYNSGLFHFHTEKDRPTAPDALTPRLTIDDKTLKTIIRRLYYPDGPYEFSVFPAEILGQVYERFLGSVIRLTAGGQAKVEQKPEVRKAGGVYYTPAYIVDYIVKHTVGKLLEGKTPQEIAGVSETWRPSKTAHLAILDPACGSGSFLLGAYRYLLDWHLEYYAKDPEKWSRGKEPRIYEHHRGGWQLTTFERRRILLANIYGVDIDTQAVEVTKLSLLLKVLESENADSLQKQFALFHQRALPDLDANIKCGNSLIGPDFYHGRQTEFDEEETYRINAFDWHAEFPQIMKSGGFDAVIGNPPYVFARDKGFTEGEKGYFAANYKHQSYQLHSFTLFIEKAHSLAKAGRMVGFIVPNNWLTVPTMSPFRHFLLTETDSTTIVNCLHKVFVQANVDTAILHFVKGSANTVSLNEMRAPGSVEHVAEIPAPELRNEGAVQFSLYRSRGVASIIHKIEKHALPLSDLARVKAGLKAYETGKGNPIQTDEMKSRRVYHSRLRESPDYRTYLEGKDVKRYSVGWSGQFLRYGRNLAAPRQASLFQGPRILVRQIPSQPPRSINAVIVQSEELNDINSMIIKTEMSDTLLFILGVLNSALMTFWFIHKFDKLQRGIFPQFKVCELSTFPIVSVAGRDSSKARDDKMVSLVQRMLDLHKRLQTANTQHERTLLQRQITATDDEIDHLVYELYDLTDEEIAIVEGK